MADASRPRRMGYVVPVLVTGLCLWLAHGALSTGIAAHCVSRGESTNALRWRPGSSATLGLGAADRARNDDYVNAEFMARRALKRSTLQADALRTLAYAEAAQSRPDNALVLMSQAGRINPRDVDAQSWLFSRALDRRDYPQAVLHADAMMRRSLETAKLLSFQLLPALADPVGRGALARRLSLDPTWRILLLSVVARYGPDADAAALFGALARSSTPPRNEEITPFLSRLISESKYRQARAYFQDLLGEQTPTPSLVYDGGFSGMAGAPPFNWRVDQVEGGGAEWTDEVGKPTGSLRVRHDGFSSSGPLVSQLVLLSPGAFQITSRAKIDDPVADGRFKLQIMCTTGARLVSLTLHAVPGSWSASRALFTVPQANCDAQWLQVIPVTGDRRELVEMSIDDILVQPAKAPAGSPAEADPNL